MKTMETLLLFLEKSTKLEIFNSKKLNKKSKRFGGLPNEEHTLETGPVSQSGSTG